MPYEVYNLDRIYLIRYKSFNNKGEKDNEQFKKKKDSKTC